MLQYLASALLFLESFHAIAHLNVLFPTFRRPLTEPHFNSRAFYFFIDTGTVMSSFLLSKAVLPSVSWWLSLMTLVQVIEHLIFAIPWASQAPHIKSIIKWSVTPASQRKQLSNARFIFFWGTLYDVLTHLTMAVMNATVIYHLCSFTNATAITSLSLLATAASFANYVKTAV